MVHITRIYWGHVYGNFHDIVKVEEMINYEIRLRSTEDPLVGSQV